MASGTICSLGTYMGLDLSREKRKRRTNTEEEALALARVRFGTIGAERKTSINCYTRPRSSTFAPRNSISITQ